ncbi:hypothetical protein J5Y04_25865 [Kitasatospora sp. RG8]|uniref:hypothetical protein n=1 Tax=Kitasatospora sp. RG8 TaxID=2820815 RepID=UPI001ADEDFCB|nr:hypothetical protein [Kitasatospora sp. RG8]MBP0452946.1 hypothetical protein [Kitasatospora sp. RG8]
MTIPGFTAESALHRTGGHYRVLSHGSARGPQVIEGQGEFLTPLCELECRGVCFDACAGNPGGPRCKRCRKWCLDDCDSGPIG